MKVHCQREELREGLALVTSVIPVKSPRPAIENVYLAASDRGLELVGTDLEVAMRYRIGNVEIEEAGNALVPARVLADFVRDLSGDRLLLETRGETFHVESGSDGCKLATSDPDEFPVVARFSDEGALAIQGQTFTRLVQRTSFAAAREQGRYAMHGILTQVEDGLVRMVATDGRRLAVASAPTESETAKKPLRAIVPTKGMQQFSRVVEDPSEIVHVHVGDNQIGMRTERAEVFARLIEGDFPRYTAVIPATSENVVEADAKLLEQKLRLVANVTSTDMRAVRLSFSQGGLEIFGRSASAGEARARLEVDFTGRDGNIAFNPDYLIDGLKHCELETVRLEFNERTSPGKFTLGENYVYVVMPITIDT